MPFRNRNNRKNGRRSMKFKTFVRKPFLVQAIEITPNNLEEVAKFVGDVRRDENGSRYILVDPRLVPNVTRVYPGYFMSKMGRTVRCFSHYSFLDQFAEETPRTRSWFDFARNEVDEYDDEDDNEGNQVEESQEVNGNQ